LQALWTILDHYKWGVLASHQKDEANNDIAVPSFIFFASLNNLILFVTPPNAAFRQYENVVAGKVFSFLVANTELFDSDPQQYARFLIRGKVAPCEDMKREYYLSICRQKIPNNPVLGTNPDVLVLTPTFVQHGLRSSVSEGYEAVTVEVTLPERSLDLEGNYVEFL
jgi:hypothetical protein